jgi:hypothetical protein
MPFALAREGADDVVGLEAGDHHQRPAHGPHELMDDRDLPSQVLGHFRPVRLVLGVDVVPEGLARRIEDHRPVGRATVQFCVGAQTP